MKNIFTGKVTPIADFIVGPKGSGVYELIK
jgi:hypothetical protein